MKLLPRKTISIIVLFALIIWFFLPEFTILSKTLFNQSINLFKPNHLHIGLISNGHIFINAEASPSISFMVDTTKNNMDLSKSNIELRGVPTAISSSEQAKENVELNPNVLRKIIINDTNTNINEIGGKTYITYNFTDVIQEGYSLVIYLNIYSTQGTYTFDWIDLTTADNWGMFFVNSYSYFLQYLIWYFAIFAGSLKTTVWSTVYNSKTKQPIVRAIIRIFKNSALIETLVSGQNGVIHTKLSKGQYTLTVIHPQYTFPSSLHPQTKDGEYKNLYYGDEFEVFKDNSALKINIPMDPKGEEMKKNFIKGAGETFISLVQGTNSVALGIFAVAQIAIWPTYLESWAYGIIGTILIVLKQVIIALQQGEIGTVVDLEGNAVPNLVMHLYDVQWNKEVLSKTTDAKGNYEFIVPNNQYYIKLEDPNYKISGSTSEGKYLLKPQKGKTIQINEKIIVEAINPIQTEQPLP